MRKGSSHNEVCLYAFAALVFGCRVLLVVRPCGEKFQVLGEGYLDGLMDGEALEMVESGRFAVSDLTFL